MTRWLAREDDPDLQMRVAGRAVREAKIALLTGNVGAALERIEEAKLALAMPDLARQIQRDQDRSQGEAGV